MTAKHYELEAAYYKGLREMNGMDPDVARDLGFVTDPDEFEAVVESAKETAAQTGSVAVEGFMRDEDAPKDEEVPEFDGINQKGGLNHVAYANHSAEQKAATSRFVDNARESMRKNRG